MKRLNKYLVYVDNGKQTTSTAITATSKKSVAKVLDGKGEVVAVKDLSESHPIKTDTIREVLQESKKFDKLEIDWIVHALTVTGIATDGTPAPLPITPSKPPKDQKSKKVVKSTEQKPKEEKLTA